MVFYQICPSAQEPYLMQPYYIPFREPWSPYKSWGVLPYTSYIGMSHPTGSGLGLKTGIYFAHFGLESGMVFEGTMGVYERTYWFNSKRIRKKKIYANLKCI